MSTREQELRDRFLRLRELLRAVYVAYGKIADEVETAFQDWLKAHDDKEPPT